MRLTEFYLPTLREIPHEAELVSHQLMLKAALIRKLGSGLYTWLPLGVRVLNKLNQIIREEMTQAGALEVNMPCVQPETLWQTSERWETFGDQLLKMQDRGERWYCFGPTHEEVVTELLRHELKSYKQLPLNVFQIQTKFRDEIRPRYGVMRAREFLMKDAYSFHSDHACLEQTYQVMYEAYQRVLERLGLDYRAVDADTGAIGGRASHEFQVLANSGEDTLVFSDSSDYAANIEKATSLIPQACPTPSPLPQSVRQKVSTPAMKRVDEVSEALNISADKMLKTLIVEGQEGNPIALLLRGDHSLNPLKAEKHPWIHAPLSFVDETKVDLPFGFLGPIELPMPYIVDHHAAALTQFCCGANETDYHLTDCQWHVDAELTETADLRNVEVGDPSPDGIGHLQMAKGIEVGHIFQLGNKYSKAMDFKILNQQGKADYPEMGCYGLGISRIVAATIEQHHDDKGICWPSALTPFQVIIVALNFHKSPMVKEAALKLYQDLNTQHCEVLLDDRNERAGVMFADSELIGIPHRVVISEKNIMTHSVEYQHRQSSEKQNIGLDQVVSFLCDCISGSSEKL